MKKFFLTLISIMMIANLSAQSQERGMWSTDVQFNLFGDNFNNFRINNLKIRRFLNDNSAVRLTLGFDINNDKRTGTNENEDPSIDKTKTYFISNTSTESTYRTKSFNIGLGYEYHKDIFDNVDIYAGGGLGFETYLYSETKKTDSYSENQNVTNTNFSNTVTTQEQTWEYFKSNDNGNINNNRFYVCAFAGVDAYIYKNLYLGFDLGLKYTFTKSANGYSEYNSTQVVTAKTGSAINNITNTNVTTTTTESSTETGVGKTVTTQSNGSSNSTPTYNVVSTNKQVVNDVTLYIEPALRLGIRF